MAHFAKLASCQLNQAFSCVVFEGKEGDEQSDKPCQQATQSMKVNIFCLSCECAIS